MEIPIFPHVVAAGAKVTRDVAAMNKRREHQMLVRLECWLKVMYLKLGCIALIVGSSYRRRI